MAGHIRTAVLAFVAGVAVSTAAVGVPALAASGPDDSITSPSVTVSATGRFIVGSQIGARPAVDPGPDGEVDCGDIFNSYHFGDIPVELRWSATGTITGFDLFRGFRGELDPTPALADTMALKFRYGIGDYDGSCGGTNDDQDFKIVAKGVGTESSVYLTTRTPTVWQEDGTSLASGAHILTQTGAWSTRTCLCFDQGKATLSAETGATSTYSPLGGQHVALVMSKGPKRGKLTVSVDGRAPVTIDTHAAAARHRVVVWTGTLVGSGPHKLVVTNKATGGRSIVIDAVMQD